MSKALYQLEKASEVFDEALPLMRQHYLEVAHFNEVDFNPDKNHYINVDNLGLSRVFTIRNDCELIGYASFYVKTHAHHKETIHAFQDGIFILPEHRGIGTDFISWCDEQLKNEGVKVVYHFVKVDHDWSKALVGVGYKCVEHIYARSF